MADLGDYVCAIFKSAVDAQNEAAFLHAMQTLVSRVPTFTRKFVLTTRYQLWTQYAPLSLVKACAFLLWENMMRWLIMQDACPFDPVLCKLGTQGFSSLATCVMNSPSFDSGDTKSVRCLDFALSVSPELYFVRTLWGFSLSDDDKCCTDLVNVWIGRWERWLRSSARPRWMRVCMS
jgi:hypothetical protein